jgi:hypothetical protein
MSFDYSSRSSPNLAVPEPISRTQVILLDRVCMMNLS